MRFSSQPYVLTFEDARRLRDVLLRRYNGAVSVRDLTRSYGIDPCIIEAAAAVGIIHIETRRPQTGRPSRIAVISGDGVNKSITAKLPPRADIPKPLSFREEDFLRAYLCKRGRLWFGGRGAGSAAHAYRAAYGKHRTITPGSTRSAGARLARQPWMRAAFLLDRRMTGHGGRLHWPADLRSAGRQWLTLIRSINRTFDDWPADVCRAIQSAKTHPEALAALSRTMTLWG